jgi:hypothetical protein
MEKIKREKLFADVIRKEYEPAGDTGHSIGSYLRVRNANFTIILAELTSLDVNMMYRFGVTAKGSYYQIQHAYCRIDEHMAVDALGLLDLSTQSIDYGKPKQSNGFNALIEHMLHYNTGDCLEEIVKGVRYGHLTKFEKGERKKLKTLITQEILPQIEQYKKEKADL